MTTLLVTGGAGFIGNNFVRLALAETDHRVVVLDKLTYAGTLLNLEDVADSPRFAFVQADIADRDAVRSVFAEHRPDRVVNFAAESHVDRSIDGPRTFLETNVLGTFELLEAARSAWLGDGSGGGSSSGDSDPDERRFLHVSTDEVYGSLGAEGLFSEETAYDPSSPYSATKAGADHLVMAWGRTYGLPVILTNCSNNYGPRQFPEKLIPLMILNAVEAEDLPIYGDGSNVRDWIHVEDHCRGVLAALERGVPGQGYNLGGRSERTNLEVVDALCAALESRRPAADNPAMGERGLDDYRDLKVFVTDRPGHDQRYAIDDSKAHRELDWAPRHDFASGLEATVEWYLTHRDWCAAVQERSDRRQRLGLGATDAAPDETDTDDPATGDTGDTP